jgi:hypothetical protein
MVHLTHVSAERERSDSVESSVDTWADVTPSFPLIQGHPSDLSIGDSTAENLDKDNRIMILYGPGLAALKKYSLGIQLDHMRMAWRFLHFQTFSLTVSRV